MKSAIFVIGVAGTGKTTLCSILQDYLHSESVNAHYMNLDPASHEPLLNTLDIRNRYHFNDEMRLKQLGPNGTLMKILDDVANDKNWIKDCLGNHDNDFIIVDCPGQVEAYLHHNKAMSGIVQIFKDNDFQICSIFTLDATFLKNKNKLYTSLLITLSTMAAIDVPVFNVVTKMDLVGGCQNWDEMIENAFNEPQNNIMLKNTYDIIDRYGISSIIPLDITDTKSIAELSLQIVSLLQYDNGSDYREPEESFS